jgi:hypothetical protein
MRFGLASAIVVLTVVTMNGLQENLWTPEAASRPYDPIETINKLEEDFRHISPDRLKGESYTQFRERVIAQKPFVVDGEARATKLIQIPFTSFDADTQRDECARYQWIQVLPWYREMAAADRDLIGLLERNPQWSDDFASKYEHWKANTEHLWHFDAKGPCKW